MTKLAIVGSGIGGCSSAYFAHKHLPDTKVTIYESEQRMGGRILTQKAYGANLELGAAFFNGSNRTILGLVNDLNLKAQRVEEYGDFRVWDGQNTVFRSNKNGLLNNLKIFAKYRSSVIDVLRLLNKAKKQLAQFYQETQKNPSEIDSLFESTGLKEYCSKPFDMVLTEVGVSQEFIDEVTAPITRTIYSQNADLGGFAGLASLIGVYGYPIYRFTDGNNAFPAHLVEASNAEVKQEQKVTGIEKAVNGSYVVTSVKGTEAFDSVIIAAPLALAGIEFDGVNVPAWEPPQYQPVFTKVLQGVLDPTFFGLKTDAELPAIILTTKEADPIKHCSIQKIENKEAIVTLTSTKPIPDDLTEQAFKSKPVQVLEHTWKAAYPQFKPIAKLPPNQLDERLFYVNAVEPAVSSMETMALSALNCILLLSSKENTG
jgi:prenylcysteine oxidase / farnesylcysteine lyase